MYSVSDPWIERSEMGTPLLGTTSLGKKTLLSELNEV